VTTPNTGLQLGRFGVWFNPSYSDDQRTEFVVQAESLGFPTAWLGFGRASISDLALVKRVLDATDNSPTSSCEICANGNHESLALPRRRTVRSLR
jgi:hypothetical protein